MKYILEISKVFEPTIHIGNIKSFILTGVLNYHFLYFKYWLQLLKIID